MSVDTLHTTLAEALRDAPCTCEYTEPDYNDNGVTATQTHQCERCAALAKYDAEKAKQQSNKHVRTYGFWPSCHGCGAPLLMENLYVDDGCPCNSPRGVNLTPKRCEICKTDNCVKPGHRLEEMFGIATQDDKPQSAGTSGVTDSGLTFARFRAANVARCVKWHPAGITSWSPSDWLTAVTGELGELASLLKMRNRERDGLPGNKFSPTDKQVADEIADVLTYLDLLAAALNVDLGSAAVSKFNEVSERVGFPDRIDAVAPLLVSADVQRIMERAITALRVLVIDLRDYPADSRPVWAYEQCEALLAELDAAIAAAPRAGGEK